jgi:hypothetical protein
MRIRAQMVCKEDMKMYRFRWNVPTSSDERLVLLALEFVVGVTNGQERDRLPGLCGLSVFVHFEKGHNLLVLQCLAWGALPPLL